MHVLCCIGSPVCMHACHIEDVHVQPLASFVGNPFVTAPQFMPTFHTCLLISPLAQATPQGTEWPHDTRSGACMVLQLC